MDLLLSICVILALLLTVTLPVARVTPLRHAFDLKYSKVSDRQKGALHPLCCCQLSCRPEGDIQSNASHRQKQQPRPCSVKVPASRQVSSQGLVLGLMQKAGFGALDHLVPCFHQDRASGYCDLCTACIYGCKLHQAVYSADCKFYMY